MGFRWSMSFQKSTQEAEISWINYLVNIYQQWMHFQKSKTIPNLFTNNEREKDWSLQITYLLQLIQMGLKKIKLFCVPVSSQAASHEKLFCKKWSPINFLTWDGLTIYSIKQCFHSSHVICHGRVHFFYEAGSLNCQNYIGNRSRTAAV